MCECDRCLRSEPNSYTNFNNTITRSQHDTTINVVKKTVGQTSEKEAIHVEETREMTFLFVQMHVNEGMMI